MRIFKLAAGKQIKIRVIFDDADGSVHAEVVGNHDGTGCQRDRNAKLIEKILTEEIPGFGGVDITAQGLTDIGETVKMMEGMNNRTQKQTPSKQQPSKGVPTQLEEEESAKKQLDTGFGF